MEKQENEMYCIGCGKIINKNAVVCPLCGVQVKELKYAPVIINQVSIKSKAVAVVLAVLFSFWSWLYTYGKSRSHFWSSVVLIILSPLIVAVIGFDFGSVWSYLIISAIPFIIWLWAIIDNAKKPYEFFINYPNG